MTTEELIAKTGIQYLQNYDDSKSSFDVSRTTYTRTCKATRHRLDGPALEIRERKPYTGKDGKTKYRVFYCHYVRGEYFTSKNFNKLEEVITFKKMKREKNLKEVTSMLDI